MFSLEIHRLPYKIHCFSPQVTSAWNKWYRDIYEHARKMEAKRANQLWLCCEKQGYRLMRSAFRLWLTDMREYILLSSLLAKGSERIRRR